MKKLLAGLAVLLVIATLYAFRKEAISVVVTGKVLHQDNGLESVHVAVVKDRNHEPLDWSLQNAKYTEPSSRDGRFRLQFNMLEGAPVYIYYLKEGYSVLQREFVASRQDEFNIGETHLINYEDDSSIRALEVLDKRGWRVIKISNQPGNPAVGEQLILFKGQSFEQFDVFDIPAIQYFTNIKRVSGKQRVESTQVENVPVEGYWYRVSFQTVGGQVKRGWIFQ